MSPPERTLGPIGWKGLFGDDESDDDRTAGDEQPTADAGIGDDPGEPRERRERAPRPSDSDRTRYGGGDGRPDRGGGASDRPDPTAAAGRPDPTAGTGRSDRATDVDERVREVRSKTAEERSGDDGAASDTPTTDPDTGYIRTDTAGSATAATGATDPAEDPATDVEADQSTQPADDPGSSSGAVDDGGPSEAAIGGGSPSRDTSNLWVNPLDDEADSSAPDSQDWEQGIVDASSAPATEPRVRTSQSETQDGESAATDPEVTSSDPESKTGEPETKTGEPEATRDDSEFTLGPIGIKGLPSRGDHAEEATVSTTEEPPARRETRSSSSTVTLRESAGPSEASRTGTSEEEASVTERLTSRVPWSISLTAIGVGVGLLVFIDIVSLMVPLIAAIGAGIVGGFVAGYISGGTVRGGMHALAVGIIGGIAVGYLTALIGALIGLFLEPATLLGSVLGPIAPELGMFGAWGPLLVMVFVTAMVAVDATIAGVVGGTLRSVVDEAR